MDVYVAAIKETKLRCAECSRSHLYSAPADLYVVDTRRWIHYCHLTRKSLKRSHRILLADKSVKVSGFQMDFPSLLIMLCRGIGLAALWSKGGEYSSRRSFNLVDPCSAGRRLQCSACRQQIRSGQASWNNRNICIWTPAACSDAGREFGKAL